MSEDDKPIIAKDEDLAGGVMENARLDNVHVHDVSMKQAYFHLVSLAGSRMSDVDLSDVTIHNARLLGLRIDHANLTNVTITDANVAGMTINGILVSDLLDRWFEGE